MAMVPLYMGREMWQAWESVAPNEQSVNKLGDTMYDHMMEIVMDKGSNHDGSLGRARMRKVAKAMLEELYNGPTGREKMVAVAGAIIDHIKAWAEIKPLSTTEIPTDGPAHIHSTVTNQGQRKII